MTFEKFTRNVDEILRREFKYSPDEAVGEYVEFLHKDWAYEELEY